MSNLSVLEIPTRPRGPDKEYNRRRKRPSGAIPLAGVDHIRPDRGIRKEDLEESGALLSALRGGNAIATSCLLAGITTTSLQQWMRRGRGGEEPYATLRERVRVAIATAEKESVACIWAHSHEYWQAAAWLLERRWPKRWGRKDSSVIRNNLGTVFALDGAKPGEAVAIVEAYLATLKASEGR